MATTPHAQHMINDVMGTTTIPPELQNDDELVTAMITNRCVGSLHTTDWLAIVETMKKVIGNEPGR